MEKGTKVGVATGGDGKFTFTVAKHDGIILVFSFVGMKTRDNVDRTERVECRNGGRVSRYG